MNKFLAAIMLLSLTACATTVPVVTLHQRTSMDLSQGAPLVLPPVQFTVVEANKQLVVVMGLEQFAQLSKNMEDIQDRLQHDKAIIDVENKYYKEHPEQKKKGLHL